MIRNLPHLKRNQIGARVGEGKIDSINADNS